MTTLPESQGRTTGEGIAGKGQGNVARRRRRIERELQMSGTLPGQP
jgi:hypothetical protein